MKTAIVLLSATVACCAVGTLVVAVNGASKSLPNIIASKDDPKESLPAGSIPGDGTWLVPTDVAPGSYRAKVPTSSIGCYWERLSGTSGSFKDIVANDNAKAGSQVVVTIASTDKAFKTAWCGSWVRI